jgi:hypothetical protein
MKSKARLCEGDTEQEISLEELEEVTLDEASALHARESVEATAQEVDALVRQDDEAMAVVEVRSAVDSPLMAVGGKIWPVSCLVKGMLALMLAQSELGVG